MAQLKLETRNGELTTVEEGPDQLPGDITALKAAVEAVSKALGDDGRILVRESGTEPVIRVMVEAGSDEICEKYVDQVIEVIKDKGHVAD